MEEVLFEDVGKSEGNVRSGIVTVCVYRSPRTVKKVAKHSSPMSEVHIKGAGL